MNEESFTESREALSMRRRGRLNLFRRDAKLSGRGFLRQKSRWKMQRDQKGKSQV